MVCDHKSIDPFVTLHLSISIKKTGYQHFVYKSDRESSDITMLEDALKLAGKAGEACDPGESSAAGANPANGRAEREVQAFEDLLRCNISALESNIGETIGSNSPIFRCLTDHTFANMSRSQSTSAVHAQTF